MIKLKLWLDDLRPPPPDDNWHWAKTADEAIRIMQDYALGNIVVTYASLDHDLGDAVSIEYDHTDGDDWFYHPVSLWSQGEPCPNCGEATQSGNPKFNGGNLFFTCCNITMDEYRHRLSRNEKTGYDFVKWLAENDVWPTDGITVHSWNAVGGENMTKTIDRYGPYDTKCRHIPDPRSMIV